MREIIFRGKTLTGKWVEGAYYKQEEFYGDKENADIIITSKETLDNDFALEHFVVIPETVRQYTGLTDKNSKPIFEGDIVNFKTTAYHFKNCRIKYQSCYARYCAIDNKGYEYPMDKSFKYKVIGNIHDNPELLKEREGK